MTYNNGIGYIVGASVRGSQLVVESWTNLKGERYGVTHVDKPEQASSRISRTTLGGVEIFDVTIQQGTKFLVSVPATGRETLFVWDGHELVELASTFDNGDGFEAEIYDEIVEVHTREEWETYLMMEDVYYTDTI